MDKKRRRPAPEEKAVILKRYLLEKVPMSDLCDEYGLQPSQIYRWQKQLFENAPGAFRRTNKWVEETKDRKIAALMDRYHPGLCSGRVPSKERLSEARLSQMGHTIGHPEFRDERFRRLRFGPLPQESEQRYRTDGTRPESNTRSTSWTAGRPC